MMDSVAPYSRYIVILFGWLLSIVGLFAVHRYKVNTLSRVVFEKRGGLNLVSNKVCHERRKPIYDTINREAGVTADAIDKIDNLQENMYLMMGAMKLEPKKFVKKDHKKIYYQCVEDE